MPHSDFSPASPFDMIHNRVTKQLLVKFLSLSFQRPTYNSMNIFLN